MKFGMIYSKDQIHDPRMSYSFIKLHHNCRLHMDARTSKHGPYGGPVVHLVKIVL